MPLNADQLEAFWEVVQADGFHRASERLYITQSAVTQRIQALEAAVGARLFVRVGRKATLTEAGQVLLRYCREQRQAEATLLSRLGGQGEELAGRLAIAADSGSGRSWVLPALAELGRRHRALDLQLVLDDAADPVGLLEAGKVDAVVGESPIRGRGLRSRMVRTTSYRLVAAPEVTRGWPDRPSWDRLGSLRAIDFAPDDPITLDHLALCMPEQSLADLRRYFVNDTRAIADWVLSGGGFSALPSAWIDGLVQAGRLRVLYPEVSSTRSLYLSAPEGPATQALGELIGCLEGSDRATDPS